MRKRKQFIPERRKYIRLNSIFPIEFHLVDPVSKQRFSPLYQAFTRNVSEGGMCLEVNGLPGEVIEVLLKGNLLELIINLPFKNPIKAFAQLRWYREEKGGYPNRYALGVEYIDIAPSERKKIFRYAKWNRRKSRLTKTGVAGLLILTSFFMWETHTVKVQEQEVEKKLSSLQQELSELHNKKTELENAIYTINLRASQLREKLKERNKLIKQLRKKIRTLSELGDKLSDEVISQKLLLEKQLQKWQEYREELEQKYIQLEEDKKKLQTELERLQGYRSARIVRVLLSNGNWITGEVLDAVGDRLILKIGMGSIGISKDMVKDIKELPHSLKVDIKQQWEREEKKVAELEEERRKFVQEQLRKGYIYFNGQWMKIEEARRLAQEMKEREEKILSLIAEQREKGLTKDKRTLLEMLLQEQLKPVISIRSNRIYVNGKLFYIKGVGYGIEYPGTAGSMDTYRKVPFSLFVQDFKMIKKAGINVIRTYEPLPPKLLDLAEQEGLMVIENICYPSDNTDFSSKVHLEILKEEIRRYVLRDKNRRCILMWSIWNDAPWAWGKEGNVVKRYGFQKVNNFLRELYHTVKKYDVDHPVTASNALGVEGEELGWDFLDVIGINAYLGGYDWFSETQAKRTVDKLKEIEQKYNKPVVILETGFSTWVPGFDQGEVLEKQIKVVDEKIAGIVIFQWADGWQKAGNKDKQDNHIEEYWGITDGYRNPKSGYYAVSRLFNLIPTESLGYNDKLIMGKKEE